MKKYIFAAALSLGIFISPIVAHRAEAATLTSTQIDAIVSLLQSFGASTSVISNVQASLSGGMAAGGTSTKNTASTASTPVITQDLKVGISNDQVAALQRKLQSLGYFPSSVQPSNYFGSVTRKAVIDFQTAHGLPALGFVGSMTRSALTEGVQSNVPSIITSLVNTSTSTLSVVLDTPASTTVYRSTDIPVTITGHGIGAPTTVTVKAISLEYSGAQYTQTVSANISSSGGGYTFSASLPLIVGRNQIIATASDGVQTASSFLPAGIKASVLTYLTPPTITIVYPIQGQTLPVGETIELGGAGFVQGASRETVVTVNGAQAPVTYPLETFGVPVPGAPNFGFGWNYIPQASGKIVFTAEVHDTYGQNASSAVAVYIAGSTQPTPPPAPTIPPSQVGGICGGIANIQCASGLVCTMPSPASSHPDQSGTCAVSSVK